MTGTPSVKKIVLLADGTGNSRRAQFRTNVWQLYDALDLSPGSRQVAFYHDGVGTSAFAPLKLIGNVFGYGVGRNVRNIYAFLCRNYEDGAQIHIFGFSRGAFTARMLAGLIASEGVRRLDDESEIAAWSREALSRYRRRNNWRQYGRIRKIIVGAVRGIKGLLRKEIAWTEPLYQPAITFVGVWDTVSAYGGPIVEMVRGWDKWVWPLSFADYMLSPRVQCARHALALDEEREAFQPLLWDEIKSVDPQRIKQVWFAGVHSDVGGGYPDQGLSNVALNWMADEASQPANGGLAFNATARAAIRRGMNACAPAHDSRSGVGVAYRYQPRRIDAFTGVAGASPTRDPATGADAMLRQAILHSSAVHRIDHRVYGYAPIALPATFADTSGGTQVLDPVLQKRIWRLVLGRRRRQFLLLFTLALMALAPNYPAGWPIDFLNDLLAPVVRAVLGSVPGVPGGVVGAYAASAGWLLILAVPLWACLRAGNRQRDRIEAVARRMWRISNPPADAAAADGTSPAQERLDALYKTVARIRWPITRFVRWHVLPALFGIGFWLIAAWCVTAAFAQISLTWSERRGQVCPAAIVAPEIFRTSNSCSPLGVPLVADQSYQIRFQVQDAWVDGNVATSPSGFGYVGSVIQNVRAHGIAGFASSTAAHLFGTALRRRIDAGWFVPVIAVRREAGALLKSRPLVVRQGAPNIYYATFTAPASGAAYVYVNDADGFYWNNEGTAWVTIAPVDPPLRPGGAAIMRAPEL